MSRRPFPRPEPLPWVSSPLLSALGVATWPQARTQAQRELLRGPRCRCCVSARVHLGRFVGSTLFFDDDPEKLRLALPPAERLTTREIAACIVLYGRERVDLLPRT
jgi:hypothetical protein